MEKVKCNRKKDNQYCSSCSHSKEHEKVKGNDYGGEVIKGSWTPSCDSECPFSEENVKCE